MGIDRHQCQRPLHVLLCSVVDFKNFPLNMNLFDNATQTLYLCILIQKLDMEKLHILYSPVQSL